jgi:hypothetical protein
MRLFAPSVIAAAALAASLAMTPLRPAEAQTVIRVCAVNQSGLVMRTRFTYADWQGTRHTSRWVTSALGERNCATLQDLQSLTIELEYASVTGWARPNGCFGGNIPMSHRENSTLFLTGTVFTFHCNREQ